MLEDAVLSIAIEFDPYLYDIFAPLRRTVPCDSRKEGETITIAYEYGPAALNNISSCLPWHGSIHGSHVSKRINFSERG